MMLRFLLINPNNLYGDNSVIKYDIFLCPLKKRKWNSESQNQHLPKSVLQDVTECYTTNDSLKNAGLNQIKQVCLLQEFTGASVY